MSRINGWKKKKNREGLYLNDYSGYLSIDRIPKGLVSFSDPTRKSRNAGRYRVQIVGTKSGFKKKLFGTKKKAKKYAIKWMRKRSKG